MTLRFVYRIRPHAADPVQQAPVTSSLIGRERDTADRNARGLTVRFDLSDRPGEPFWMLLRRPYSELCSAYLGWDEDLNVCTDTETLARWHLRRISYSEAVRTGVLRIDGAPASVKAFLRAMRASPFAGTQPV